MKKVLFVFSLVWFSAFSQKDVHALTVYLSDAETGKNVKGAKVTLEGFEIPAIEGKYDKKNKSYYFDNIPNGYNTVMTYHEKYNEKGFQNTAGLPKELKIKLYVPIAVSYGFEKPVLSKEIGHSGGKKINYARMPKNLDMVLKTGKTVSNPNFRYIYVEDQYHIAIISKYDSKQFFENDTIKKILDELSLEEFEQNDGSYQKYAIDIATGNLASCKKGGCLIMNGVDYVYVLRKKEGAKFKRFNSPEIKKLREKNFKVAALTNRKLEYYGEAPFNAERYYGGFYKNLMNAMQYHDFRPGKIGQAYWDTQQKEYKMYYGSFDPNSVSDNMPSSDDDIGYSIFFVIPKHNNSGIGLGVLDNIEADDSTKDQYFFNNKYNN
ncbi:hypothetical protein [Flavobacterium sp. UBA7682]|uniref:hypothetical protein n=1 Tax=Flavobacterium sp. UBA7682 TaxID=1946560 RepID=UPI0025C3A3B2|nr:hypothetical protein [Flavobacterium sp. UBA7682]